MPTSSLNQEKILLNDGLDSIVVVQALSEIPGGRSLDVSGVAEGTTVIKSGNVLVQDNTSKAISPLNITDGAYVALPEGKSYVGVLKNSVLVRDPRASIITAGQINAAASPAPITDDIKAALPRIEWLYA